MLMLNTPVQPDPPLYGLEYRRWLAVNGDAVCAPVERASDEDVATHRRAKKDASACEPQAAQEPELPPMTAMQHWTLERSGAWGSSYSKQCGAVLAAWLECWPAFESGCNSIGGWSWQTWVSMLNFAGIPGAGDELDLLDAEPLAENEHDEQMAVRSGWAREQMIRNIWRERYGIDEPGDSDDDDEVNDRRAADAEEQFSALVDSLAGMTNEEIMEEQDRLRMERQERYVAKQRKKNQRYRERPEKVDPRQMMLGEVA